MMLKKYEDLNLSAKEYLIQELDEICNDSKLLKRCYKEINILFDKGLLFIIRYLYDFKKENNHISYHFRGMANNLLLLYILDISKVDPIKYNLPYELFTDKRIDVDLINGHVVSLLRYFNKCSEYVKIVSGSFEKDEEIEEINVLQENHYLFIPFSSVRTKDIANITFKLNRDFVLETVEDYRIYKDTFLFIRIDEKCLLYDCDEIKIENVLDKTFELEVAAILKPKTVNDYIKIKSLSHGSNVWKLNQDELFKEGKININNLIATREDIFEYLLAHSVDRDIAIDIINYLLRGYKRVSSYVWQKYEKIMKENKCDDMFIQILSKILFIFGRGQAVSECLFVLDEDNYLYEKTKPTYIEPIWEIHEKKKG